MERDNLRRRRPRRLGTAFGGILTAAFLAGAVGPVAGAAAAAPEITTQPTSQEVVEPNAATFVAGASGTPTPSVQWEVAEDGVVGGHFHNLEGATSSTLKVEPTSASQSGYAYRAVFTNGEAPPAISSAVTLTVDVPPKITMAPTSVELSEPADATFTARATGAPNPTVQWSVSKDGGKTWADVPGATSETLTVAHPTSAENGNEYRALFSNKAGFATSPEAMLTVRAAPQVTSSPASRTVLAGEATSFTATGTGTPTPSVQWEYSTNGGSTFINLVGANSPTLTIEHATVSENGRQYRAKFTNGTGSPATSGAATLTVNAAPVVTKQPANEEVTEPQTATFKAEASGSPAPSVQWEVSKDGGGTFNPVPNGISPTLKIENTTLSQRGNQYRATFTNGVAATSSQAATLTVNTLPSVTSAPESTTVLAGTTATFSATSSGTPKPTVHWQVFKNGGGKWETLPGATSEQLKIENAKTSQSGYQYRAVFTSAGGEAGSAAATLTVYARPVVTITAPANGSSTSSELQRVEGTASIGPGDLPTVTVNLYEGATAEGSPKETHGVTADKSGHWSTAFGGLVKDGTYTLRAEQSDKAGFVGLSAPVSFTVNTALPNVTLTSPASGSTSTTASPTFEGGADTTRGDSSTITLNLYEGATAGANLVRTSTATAVGGHWATTVERPLKNGTYTARAEQSNELGGVGQSSGVTFTVAKPAPLVSISSPENNSSTSSSTQPVEGTAATRSGALPTVTIKIFEGTTTEGALKETHGVTAASGHWTTKFANLKGGTYTLRAEQSDELGNVGLSPAVTFTVNTAAPKVTLTAPTNGSSSSTGAQTFAGDAGTLMGDIQTVMVSVYEGPTAAGQLARTGTSPVSGGKWSIELKGLKNGTYTARAEQADELGIVGQSAPVTFTVAKPLPVVKINLPVNESSTGSATQPVEGSASTGTGIPPAVTIKLFEGAPNEGPQLEAHEVTADAGGHWGTKFGRLKGGTYTLQAEQSDALKNVGLSNTVTFTVTTKPPAVTLTSPANGSSSSTGSQAFEGGASMATGVLPTVTLNVYEGSTTSGHLVRTSLAQALLGSWSTSVEGLGNGTYTARAEQSDEIGNLGTSAQVTFKVAIPPPVHPPPSPPVASFTWFPAAPHVGEQVSLASNSTDSSSPITAAAWDVSGNGPFAASGSVLTTSFATVGSHAVRLRVSDANGLSSIATRTIAVSAPLMSLMQPFPIVRIAGSDYPSGVKLSLLSVLSPVGTLTTVNCRGRGCPIASQSRVSVATRNRRNTVAVASRFRRFERSLRAGVVLEIRVTKPGLIGKYTRFAIRRGLLPVRTDACIGSKAPKPITCPSS